MLAYSTPSLTLPSLMLIEGQSKYFIYNTFVREYSQNEIKDIINACGLVNFDKVEHEPGYTRLLGIARK
ncbi:MAG: hypothetical protein M3P08_14115 [Thermoproteota archaeon]|nr:hypothetical protein [Thermoproteota archaeon]